MMSDLLGYPFESQFKGFDEYENPIFDRALAGAQFRAFWAAYYTNGVFFDPANNFQTTATGGTSVSVEYGVAHIQGLTILPDAAASVTLALQPALATSDRYDLIVLRADFTANRSAEVVVKTGASMPEDLQRDSAVWELGLAKVLVRQSATTVNQSDITDLRLSEDFCGLVTEPITRTNTEHFFAQMQAQLGLNQAQWDAFYASIGEDIGALIEHATIQMTQVEGLTEALERQVTVADVAGLPDALAGKAPLAHTHTTAQVEGLETSLAGKAVVTNYTATLTTTWTGTVAPYTQAVTVAGLLATDNPIVSVVPSATFATALLQVEAWGLIRRAVTAANAITFYAAEKPTIAIPIQLKVVR